MVQRHQPFLDVGAGAHFLGAADQDADRTAAHPIEQRLFLGVGIGVADGGHLRAGDSAGFELVDDVFVDREAPFRGVHAQIAEDHLRAAGGCGFPPGRGDIFGQGVDLRWRVIGGGARK